MGTSVSVANGAPGADGSGLAWYVQIHSTMTAATHDEIVALIGEMDELLLERLVATGASVDEISEAWADLENEHRLEEGRTVGVSPRVAEVRAILEQVQEDIEDEGDGHAAIAHEV